MNTWRTLFILLVAALASVGIYRAVQSPEPGRSARNGHVPSAYATALTTRRFNASGRLTQILEANRMTRFADDGTTELKAPKLHLYPEQGPRWRATAAVATISANGGRIALEDRVRIHRLPDHRTPPGLFVTRYLLVFPERNEAETDRRVRWETPDLTVTATGMRARLDTSEVDLLSRVRARLAPPRNHRKDKS